MADELGEPLELCLFPFGSDDPIRARPLVPRGLGTEKFPSGLVGAKLLFLLATEAGALSLLVRVDAGFLFAACGESLEAGGIIRPCFVSFRTRLILMELQVLVACGE